MGIAIFSISALAVLIGVPYINYLVATSKSGGPVEQESGWFGDLFGFSNAIFSGLAFVGVAIAVFLQRYEIDLTRQELDISQSIFYEQEQSLKLANTQSRIQMFESTFFNLLNLLKGITDGIAINQGDISLLGEVIYYNDNIKRANTVSGKQVFPYFVREIEYFMKNDSGDQLNSYDQCYRQFYNHRNSDLGHYFRTLYNIVDFVDTTPYLESAEQKKKYANFLRAQLSDHEAALLFYNGLSSNGVEKFKPLIERYALLKNAKRFHASKAPYRLRYSQDAFG